MRFYCVWGDTDETYHRRCSRMFKDLQLAADVPDFDRLILGHMYDYIGHIIRECERNLGHLTGWVIRFWDSLWKQTMTALQGHAGRVSPWCWERQYHSFFWEKGLHWIQVAKDKQQWCSYKAEWIQFMAAGK